MEDTWASGGGGNRCVSRYERIARRLPKVVQSIHDLFTTLRLITQVLQRLCLWALGPRLCDFRGVAAC